MVKQEPTAYAWETFVKDGKTAWTGVRNFQARNNLRSMKRGDTVLYYHSVEGKEVVGIAEVVEESYPDPTATEGDWVCVDLSPVESLSHPVSLERIKATASLSDLPLLKQSRLSVMPITSKHYRAIVDLGKTPGKTAKKK